MFTIKDKHEHSRPRSEKKRNLYRLALADLDIRAALYACKEFIRLINAWNQKTLPYIISNAFISSIVTCYSRPFVRTRKNSVGDLPRPWHVFAEPRLQDAHSEMLRLRHELFAHTDPALHPMSIVPAGFDPGIGRPVPGNSWHIGGQMIPPWRVPDFGDTCQDLQTRLERAIVDLMEELYGDMDLPRRQFPLRFDEGL